MEDKAIDWWKSLSISQQKTQSSKLQTSHTCITLVEIITLYSTMEREIILVKAVLWYNNLPSKYRKELLNMRNTVIRKEGDTTDEHLHNVILHQYYKALEMRTWFNVIKSLQ